MSQFLLYATLSILLMGSIGIWARARGRLRDHQPLLPYHEREPVAGDTVLFVIVLLIVLLGLVRSWTAERNVPPSAADLEDVQRNCIGNAALTGMLFVALLLTSNGRLSRYGMSLTRLYRQVLDGIDGYVASLLPVTAVLLLTLPLRSTEKLHPFLQLLRTEQATAVIGWTALAAVVLAPLAEELTFRVVLQGWLQQRIPPGWAIGIVAALFAAVHNWPDSLPVLPLALVLGYVYYRRFSYVSAVVTHSLFNATNMLIQLVLLPAEKM